MSEETKETKTTNTEQPARRTEGDNRTDSRGANRSDSRGDNRGDRRGGPRKGGRRFQRRRKFCKFCADTSLQIDYKNPDLLGQFITDRSKILPSRVTGTCSKHQRQLTTAVKRARILALLAFTPLHHD